MQDKEKQNVLRNLERQYEYLRQYLQDKLTIYNIRYIKEYMRKNGIEENNV